MRMASRSVSPIYQVMSSLLENNILKWQNREKPNRSLPSVFLGPALIRKVASLGVENNKQRYCSIFQSYFPEEEKSAV